MQVRFLPGLPSFPVSQNEAEQFSPHRSSLHCANFPTQFTTAGYQQLKLRLPLRHRTCILEPQAFAQEIAMPNPRFAMPTSVLALARLTALCFLGTSFLAQSTNAQSANDQSPNSSSNAPAHSMQPANLDNNSDNNSGNNGDRDSGQNSAITFQGRIVKSGIRLVLAANDDTTYQLDNQRKAHNFLNQNVKVTGELDATTGTIRIRAIGPV
jgi:hypothetical protein